MILPSRGRIWKKKTDSLKFTRPRLDPTRLRGAAVAARPRRTLDPMEVPGRARSKWKVREDTTDPKKGPWEKTHKKKNIWKFQDFFLRSNIYMYIYIYTWNFRLCEIIARSWNNTFFCCLVNFLLFSKNNAVSCLGFWLLGNACQPDLFLRFLDGKLCRFKFLSAPLWEVQVPQNGPKPKNARRQKKMQVPQKSNNFWKSKNLTSFGRSRYILYINMCVYL